MSYSLTNGTTAKQCIEDNKWKPLGSCIGLAFLSRLVGTGLSMSLFHKSPVFNKFPTALPLHLSMIHFFLPSV